MENPSLKGSIIDLHKAGSGFRSIAKRLDCSQRYVERVIARFKAAENLSKMRPLTNIEVPKVELYTCDWHVPHHDTKVRNRVIEYGQEVGVDLVVIGGDFGENERLSPWPKDPESPRTPLMFAAMKRELIDLRDAFPKARIIVMEGNHDGWFRKYLWNHAPELVGLKGISVPEQLDLEGLEIDYIDSAAYIKTYNRPFRVGKLFHLHGDELGMGGGCINVARSALLKLHDNVIMGHWHRDNADTNKTADGSLIGAWSIGCIRDLHPRFRPLNNWVNGFAIIPYKPNGQFHVNKFILDRGKILGVD